MPESEKRTWAQCGKCSSVVTVEVSRKKVNFECDNCRNKNRRREAVLATRKKRSASE
jgi:DNA-directed RNA polymerase subunit M/transcription elongation factor TFIIS